MVIKATGLAAGKGVIVPNDFKEAEAAIKEMLVDQKFGQASERILIEEFMNGTEISVLAFTDGDNLFFETNKIARIFQNESSF